MRKVLCIFLIFIMLISLFLLYFESGANAATSSTDSSNDYVYSQYEELIAELQAEHPNWEFEIYETGLEWADVLKAETVAKHGRSLIQSTDSNWRCSTCGTKQYETGWYCASVAAVAYYLDPRNSLCEDYVFQFEQLTYDADNQTTSGVEQILVDCTYMQGKITYTDTNGKTQTIDKTYIEVIMEAAEEYNVSPYHIASRIRQEMGTGSGSTMISGTVSGYVGYYNYFNWGAYGSDIIGSGLKTAKSYGWTDPETAIMGGVQLLAKNYISIGQDTLYLQKFDVVDGGDGYYGHQYMTNVSASKTEGLTVKNAYEEMGLLDSNATIKFKVPIYENMPTTKAGIPGQETIVTQDVQVTSEVNVREGQGTSTKIIATLSKGTKILRIELAESKDSSGYYWDKVVLSDGIKGYCIRSNITQISTQSNCSTKYLVMNEVALRNGPGTENTDIVNYISEGTILTVIEKDKYPDVDGDSWYRVKLTDGSVGYVAVGDTSDPNLVVYDSNSSEYGYVEVVCTDGLRVRSSPTTSENNVITTVTQGTKLFRLAKNVSNDGGYIWDKVVTTSGIVGYVVRQDKTTGEAWIQAINDNYTIDDENLNIICVPNITVNTLSSLASDVVVKNGSTTITGSTKIGTGYTITADGITYTAVVMGDVNGDGKINSGDLLKIVKHLKATAVITDSAILSAADVNSDGTINSGDLLKIVKYLKGTGNIEI